MYRHISGGVLFRCRDLYSQATRWWCKPILCFHTLGKIRFLWLLCQCVFGVCFKVYNRLSTANAKTPTSPLTGVEFRFFPRFLWLRGGWIRVSRNNISETEDLKSLLCRDPIGCREFIVNAQKFLAGQIEHILEKIYQNFWYHGL